MINEQPDTLLEIEPASGGNPNVEFEYEWVKSIPPNGEEPADGVIDQPYYIPPPLLETTIFKRKARREGFTGYMISNPVTIEVEPTSIENITTSKIKLYPNPTTDHLQIEFAENNSSDWLIEVFDIKGSLQKTFELEDVQNIQTIDLRSITKGTYLIQLTNFENNKAESFKIVKEE